MLDVNQSIVSALKAATGYEVYYELFGQTNAMPCITYLTYDNSEILTGNKISYSSIGYYIKLWGTDLSVLLPKYQLIDEAMRTLGYVRESYNELAINDEICLIGQYRALGKEERS